MQLNMGAVQIPKESLHWKLTLGQKSLAMSGTQTCISIAPGFQSDVLPTGPSLPRCAWVCWPSRVTIFRTFAFRHIICDILIGWSCSGDWQPRNLCTVSTAASRPAHLSNILALNDDVGTMLATRRHLHEWCHNWHHHGDGNTQGLAMVGQCQSVVASTGCYHPALLLFLGTEITRIHRKKSVRGCSEVIAPWDHIALCTLSKAFFGVWVLCACFCVCCFLSFVLFLHTGMFDHRNSQSTGFISCFRPDITIMVDWE